mmetsp:Transcript_26634/g.54844  ORF Transcript_26634/g.54844 Transcript_26634/m.54844 type:complete len:738 (-) Transcript_26634:29-2242(-)
MLTNISVKDDTIFSDSGDADSVVTRTIDFFLDQTYQYYKEKLHGHSRYSLDSEDFFDWTRDSYIDATSRNEMSQMEIGQNHSISNDKSRGPLWCFSREKTILKLKRVFGRPLDFYNICCGYRQFLPLPLLALCIANSSDATEILMLSYLLANPNFRRDMFTRGDDTPHLGYASYLQENDNSQHNNESFSGYSASLEGAEYLAASIFLGMLLGGTILGFLSDQIGRRPALLTGLLLNAIAGTLSSIPLMTPTVHELTIIRFFAGVGIGATVPPLFSLASEWSPKEVRGGIVTAVASFWMMGSLFVSVLAWCLFHGNESENIGVSRWRIFAAICAMPSALGVFMVYLYVPESPRFLASVKDDYKQSAQNCNLMAKALGLDLDVQNVNLQSSGGGLTKNNFSSLGREEFHEGVSAPSYLQGGNIRPMTEEEVRMEFLGHGTNDRAGVWNHTNLRNFCKTFTKLYTPPILSRTTLPLKTIWFSLSFGTYGITTWINSLFVAIHLENIYFNSFLFALANLPGNILSVIYSDRWGRKKMLMGSLIGAAASLVAFACFVYSKTSNSQFGTFVIVFFACAFQMFSIVSWNSIDVLSGELFPTKVRSAGMGVCTASGRLGAMFAQFVNASLMVSASKGGDNNGGESNSDALSSARVLVVAASALLLGAGLPLCLERDMAGSELKDEVGSSAIRCNSGSKKDHLSDDEADLVLNHESVCDLSGCRLQNAQEYQSFRDEVAVNEPFLL